MRKIVIFGDTSQDISQNLAKEYGIETFSYQVQMDDEHYKDQIDIDTKTFYEKLPHHKVLMTGTPPPGEITEKLEEIKENGATDVIMISSSSKLTAMYSIYSSYGKDFEGVKLHLFDTKSIGAGAGLYVIYASMLRDKGYTPSEILKELEDRKKQSSIYALFRTLTYLVKGGRFNKYKGMLGNLLNIKPLLYTEDGLISVKDKFRGKSKSLDAMVKVVKEDIRNYKKYFMVIYSGENQDEVIILKEKLNEEIANSSLFIETELTPVLGVHSGPNAIGVALLGIS